MNLVEAHDYMDMLLDKAEQPYFTTIEKDRYLSLAISEFVNTNYRKMGADEDARRAIANCIDWNKYTLTPDDITSENYIYNSTYPALSEKYTNTGILDQSGAVVSNSAFSTAGIAPENVGFFKYGNQYVLPKNHLFTLAIQVDYYNRKEIMDLNTGKFHTGKDASDIVLERVTPQAVNISQYYERHNTLDPFQSANTSDKAGTSWADSFGQTDYQQKNKRIAYWSYIEGRINISHSSQIMRFYIQSVTLPTVKQAFTSNTMGGNSPSPKGFIFADHYQRKIIQLAVRKASGATETGDFQK